MSDVSVKPVVRALVLSMIAVLSACSAIEKKAGPETQVIDPVEQKRAELSSMFKEALDAQLAGDTEDAMALYQSLLSKDPEHSGAWFNMAQLALKNDDKPSAKEFAEKALTYQPGHKQSANLLGVLSREEGEFDEAEKYYRIALDADPSYRPAIRNLAVLLDLYRGRLEEALALYEQLQSLGDEDSRLKDWIFDLKRRLEAS